MPSTRPSRKSRQRRRVARGRKKTTLVHQSSREDGRLLTHLSRLSSPPSPRVASRYSRTAFSTHRRAASSTASRRVRVWVFWVWIPPTSPFRETEDPGSAPPPPPLSRVFLFFSHRNATAPAAPIAALCAALAHALNPSRLSLTDDDDPGGPRRDDPSPSEIWNSFRGGPPSAVNRNRPSSAGLSPSLTIRSTSSKLGAPGTARARATASTRRASRSDRVGDRVCGTTPGGTNAVAAAPSGAKVEPRGAAAL